MLERVIIDGIPVYKDKESNAAYIYDTGADPVPLGTIEGGKLVLNEDWRETTKGRLDKWRETLEVRKRAGK